MYLNAKEPGKLINPRSRRGEQASHDAASNGDWDTMEWKKSRLIPVPCPGQLPVATVGEADDITITSEI
jgi:hypothetical protein